MAERGGVPNPKRRPQPTERHLELTRFSGRQLDEIDQAGATFLRATPNLSRDKLITSIWLCTIRRMTVSRVDEALGVINQMLAARISLLGIREVIVREPLMGKGLFYEVNLLPAQDNLNGRGGTDREYRPRQR